jgi:predicted Zn-dependent protease with MMP-like domain
VLIGSVGDDGDMIDVPMEQFEELVGEALDTIPDGLARLMQNVAVFVEDQSPRRPDLVGDERDLLGLYEGIPLTERGQTYAGILPDRITIYRIPILRECRTTADVVTQVRKTVIHEVAHHFGISDDRLHELDAY